MDNKWYLIRLMVWCPVGEYNSIEQDVTLFDNIRPQWVKFSVMVHLLTH